MSETRCQTEGCAVADCPSCQRMADLEAQLVAARAEGQQDRDFEWRVGDFALRGALAVNPSRKVAIIYGENDEKVIDACGDTTYQAIRTAFAEYDARLAAVAQPETET